MKKYIFWIDLVLMILTDKIKVEFIKNKLVRRNTVTSGISIKIL